MVIASRIFLSPGIYFQTAFLRGRYNDFNYTRLSAQEFKKKIQLRPNPRAKLVKLGHTYYFRSHKVCSKNIFHAKDITRAPIIDKDFLLNYFFQIGPSVRYIQHDCLFLNWPDRGGCPIKWHQDWVFWPHTNQSLVTGFLSIDDSTRGNGKY